MRYHVTRIAGLIIVAIALLGVLPSSLAAQEATPAAVVELAPGVTAEIFSAVPSDRAPGQTLYIARFVFGPGSEIFPHRHPGTVVLAVEDGTFGWTLLEGQAHVIRGAAFGATEPVEDITEAGTEVILNSGDTIYYEDDVVHTARHAGGEPVVLLSSIIVGTGDPLLIPMEDMAMGGTPTP